MPWFVAHAVLYVRFKRGGQSSYPVWENVYLVEAPTSEGALAAAESRAREDEGDSNGSFTWEGRPAEWVFAGVRKLVTVALASSEARPGHGDELTYSEFSAPSLEAVHQLAAGGTVEVKYTE